MRSSRSCATRPTLGTAIINGLIVVLWRAGLPINEALSLTDRQLTRRVAELTGDRLTSRTLRHAIRTDLEEQRGSVLVRQGKNDRGRQVGRDAWGWTLLGPWLAERRAAGRAVVLRDRRTDCRARLVGQRRQAPATSAGG
jgi:hypothetical protein